MPETDQDRPTGIAGLALYWLASLLLFLPQVVWWQVADFDLWGRISVGAVLSQTGSLPAVDDFSFVARGASWIDHEWLSGVIFFEALDRYGETGLHLLKFALIAVCFLCIFLLHRSIYRVRPAIAGLVLIALAPAALVGFVATLRAQSFSIPLALVFVVLLEAIRLERLSLRHLAWLVPISVFWGNAHGGVAMGLLAVAVYGGSELVLGRTRRAAPYLLAIAAMVLALSWLNPYGPEYMTFLIKAWGMDRSRISEWHPLLAGGTGWHHALAVAVAALSLAISLLGTWTALRIRLGARSRDRSPSGSSPLAPSLLLGLWLVMTLIAQRILPFLVLTLVALLPVFAELPGLRRLSSRLQMAHWLRGRVVELGLPIALCALGVAAMGWVSQSRPLLASILPSERNASPRSKFVYPEGAVRYLLDCPFRGKLLNPFTQGEFLYWVLYPKFRVASDGRYEEVYSETQFRQVYDFYHIHRSRRPEATIEFANRSGADFVLFRTVWDNMTLLAESPEWRVVYRDEIFALLAREQVLATHPDYQAPSPLPRGRRATIADYFDGFDRGPGRFYAYP